MNEAILIWLYIALGNIFTEGGFFNVMAVLFTILCVIQVAAYAITLVSGEFEEGTVNRIKTYAPARNRILFAACLYFILAGLYPSKEDLSWIIGGALVWNGGKAVTQIEGAKELPENLVNAMNRFLVGVEPPAEAIEE